jgi:hypothetical protein
MVIAPLFRLGVEGDFGVEDEKAFFKLADAGADFFAMLFEQFTAFGRRGLAKLAQFRVAQHLRYRHPRRFEATQKRNPGQD